MAKKAAANASPSGSVEVSPAQLAKLTGYTERQVQKWCLMGLPHRTQRNGKRADKLINRDTGLAWIKGNATGIPGAHGGKRPGSGKKKVQGHSGTRRGVQAPARSDIAAPAAPPPVTSAPAAPSPPRRLTPPKNLEAASFLPPGHPDERKAEDPPTEPAPFAPLTPQALRQLTPVEVKQHLDIEKILSERVARGEKEGTLISVEDARKEWSDACTAAARVLGKMRDTLASRLITDLGLPTERAPRLRQVIQQEAAHVLRAMRTASLGPDEDLDIPEDA